MTTVLHSTLKRALIINGRDYLVTLTSASLKLTLKGKRNGVELPWSELVNGEAALAVALNASVGAFSSKLTTAAANDKSAVTGKKAARAKQRQSPKPRRLAAARRRP